MVGYAWKKSIHENVGIYSNSMIIDLDSECMFCVCVWDNDESEFSMVFVFFLFLAT